MERSLYVKVEGRVLKFSHLGKILYPRTGFTKGDVLRYYRDVAPALLPHLLGRPLTLKRYPEGVEAPFFFEKRCPRHAPPWLGQIDYDGIRYCSPKSISELLWIVHLGALELHPQLSAEPRLDSPTQMVFDLDPGAPAGIRDCAWLALILRDRLRRAGLESWAKTSGSKGLHVCVPLNTPCGFSETKQFSREIAESLEREFPDRVTARMRKTLRSARIFIDWSQNDAHKTTVAVYSLRATDAPGVSCPVSWRELEQARSRGESSLLVFDPGRVLERLRRQGDLFRPLLELRQSLPRLQSAG